MFDDVRYKKLIRAGYFQDDHDIALLSSIDRYQIFKQKCDDCWIVLFINANLPPEQHVKKKNLLITTIISDPKSLKNFNFFMMLIIKELRLLEGNYLMIKHYLNKFKFQY